MAEDYFLSAKSGRGMKLGSHFHSLRAAGAGEKLAGSKLTSSELR